MLDTFTDPRDGTVYKTVKIGSQIWMAENLNYNHPCSYLYDNDPKNGEKYGRLYDWDIAEIACPPSWHLPTNEEWDVLINFLGGKEVAGKHLKDASGFAALMGGFGYYFDDSENFGYEFSDIGESGTWWSASEYGKYWAYYQDIYADHRYYCEDVSKHDNLFSVRCINSPFC